MDTVTDATTANPASDGSTYRYWAFISYSHQDTAFAKRIHSDLETWPIPRNLVGRDTPVGKTPRRLFPIFRDRDEISVGESLDEVILAALKTSRYLVVICSPRSAASKYVNEEIRAFKAMGRGSRIVYVIVDGEPGGPVSGDPARAECFPAMARCRVAPDGTTAPGEVEPIAADARKGKDGSRDAVLKVVARMLDVGFDDLKRRDQQRRRRARAKLTIVAAALLLLIAGLYTALVDNGAKVPFGDSIRARIDRHELSVFRHVENIQKIRAVARSFENTLATNVLKKRQPDAWINDAPPGETPSLSIWSHSQGMIGLLRRPISDKAELDKLIESVDMAFRPNLLTKSSDGVKWGWHEHGQSSYTSYMPCCMALALCEALHQPLVQADPAVKERMRQHLLDVQEVLRLFHHDAEPGAWDAAPFLEKPELHSVFSSTLALMAMLEARRGDLPWDGSAERRDELIRQTANWLMSQYHTTGRQRGWVNNPHEEHASEIFDGLTLETYCALMATEASGVGFVVPAEMRQDIRHHLAACSTRNNDYAIDAGEMILTYRHINGQMDTDRFAIRYLWWPWALRAADLWLRHAEHDGTPPEEYVEVRRAFDHLVITLGPQQIAKVIEGYSYVMSEDLWCLRSIDQE